MFLKITQRRDIRMISEESWDTADWSNDTEIQLCHHRHKLHVKIY